MPLRNVQWQAFQHEDGYHYVIMIQFNNRILRAIVRPERERVQYAIEQLSSFVRKERALELQREYSAKH